MATIDITTTEEINIFIACTCCGEELLIDKVVMLKEQNTIEISVEAEHDCSYLEE